jgi:hypothetical protein
MALMLWLNLVMMMMDLIKQSLCLLLQLLVVSPLTRALRTATLAFGHQPGGPVLVEWLWRERLYLSSDVGRPGQQPAQEFP